MGFQLEGGTGNGYVAKVNADNKLEVRSESVDESGIIAQRDQLYFNWQSDYSATANDIVLYIKNTSADKDLAIRKCYMHNATACDWEFRRVDAGTAAGTAVTAVNLAFGSNIAAEATAYGNAAVTGITSSTVMWSYRTAAATPHYLDANGAVIVKPNNAIAVKTTATGAIKVYVAAYYIKQIIN